MSIRLLIPTFSPQGDGNLFMQQDLLEIIKCALIPTFSPQGDGNYAKFRR